METLKVIGSWVCSILMWVVGLFFLYWGYWQLFDGTPVNWMTF